jgi:transcription factor SPN1
MLEAVKRWLEPLEDRSLPALNIQRPIFSLLRTVRRFLTRRSPFLSLSLSSSKQIAIETSALKSSGLGKIVYFYTKCKRVDPAIARTANQLVSDWMRPILRRSKAFVDRDLASGYSGKSHSSALAVAGTQEPEAQASRHARIPQAMTSTFVNAPRLGAGQQGAGASMPGQGSGARMREFKKKLVDAKTAARRV